MLLKVSKRLEVKLKWKRKQDPQNCRSFYAFEKDKTNPNNQKYEGPCSRLTEFTRNKNVRIKKIQAKRLLQNFGSFQQKCCQNS